MALTEKQEAFAQALACSYPPISASDAYRRAYRAERMKPATVNRMAHGLTRNSKVAARIAELREQAAERNAITVDALLQELAEARDAALQSDPPQVGAAVSATMGRAKLLGLDKLTARLEVERLALENERLRKSLNSTGDGVAGLLADLIARLPS